MYMSFWITQDIAYVFFPYVKLSRSSHDKINNYQNKNVHAYVSVVCSKKKIKMNWIGSWYNLPAAAKNFFDNNENVDLSPLLQRKN